MQILFLKNPLLIIIITINKKETRIGLTITSVAFQENQETFRFEIFPNIMTWMVKASKTHASFFFPCCYFSYIILNKYMCLCGGAGALLRWSPQSGSWIVD